MIVTLVTTWANSYLCSYGFAVAFISGYMLWTTSGKLGTLDLVPDYLFGVPVTLAGIAMLALGHLGALVSLQQLSLLVHPGRLHPDALRPPRVPLDLGSLAVPAARDADVGLPARPAWASKPGAIRRDCRPAALDRVCQPSRRAP